MMEVSELFYIFLISLKTKEWFGVFLELNGSLKSLPLRTSQGGKGS